MDEFDFMLDFPTGAAAYDHPIDLLGNEHLDLEALLSSADSTFELPNDLELPLDSSFPWDLAELDQFNATSQSQLSERSSDDGFVSITPHSSNQRSIDDLRFNVAGSKEDCRDKLTDSSKRKWEDSVIIFDMNPEKKAISRKRKAYDDARRKEVAMNRAIGACVQCKLRKGSVSLSLHCHIWSC